MPFIKLIIYLTPDCLQANGFLLAPVCRRNPPPLQPPTTPPWLQARITEQEVYKVFKKVRRHKAVGPDKLYNFALVEAQSVLVPFLTKLYNLSWYMEYTPQIWRMSDYYTLLKPGRDAHSVSNYRPLQLSSQLARLLAAIIANRLLTHCSTEPKYQLQYWNVAFQPNKAIDDMLVNLVTDGKAALARNSAMNVVAADISSAYDSIHIESLMYKLRRNFDLTGRILNWLYNFLKLRWTRVVIGNSTGGSRR